MEVIIGILILCVVYFLFLHFGERIRPKDEIENPEKEIEMKEGEGTRFRDKDSCKEQDQ